MSEPEDFVMCRICGKEFQQIYHSHLRGHGMTSEEYQSKFSGAPVISEKSRKKISAALTGRTLTEQHRVKISGNRIGAVLSEETKAKISKAMTGPNHPMYGKTFIHTKEAKAKISVAATEQWKDPKIRDKMCMSQIGERHHNWKGGISFFPYCRLFNESLKEGYRNFWGRVCVLTDLMRSTLGLDAGLNEFEGHEIFNRRRLSVHHIYGNKMAGCDGTELALIPLQESLNTKRFDGLKLEDHPFYITLFMFKNLERKSREQHINGS